MVNVVSFFSVAPLEKVNLLNEFGGSIDIFGNWHTTLYTAG